MVEFNPDGSIKLTSQMQKKREDDQARMAGSRCMRIRREVVSLKAPKRCVLHLKLSNAILDKRFVESIYREFLSRSAVPSKIRECDEHSYDIEIGSDYKRCSDCSALIRSYREFLDGNVIEDRGSCTLEQREWAEEDYFS